jgi:hypothetical protein
MKFFSLSVIPGPKSKIEIDYKDGDVQHG